MKFNIILIITNDNFRGKRGYTHQTLRKVIIFKWQAGAPKIGSVSLVIEKIFQKFLPKVRLPTTSPSI